MNPRPGRHGGSLADSHALRVDLFREVLARFRRARLRVTGTSMLPTLWPGDVLEIQACAASELTAGDIVLFQRQGGLTCHRIRRYEARHGQLSIRTAGDHLLDSDPAIGPRDILGKLVHVSRQRPLRLPRFFRGPLAAWILRHSSRASSRVTSWLLRIAAAE